MASRQRLGMTVVVAVWCALAIAACARVHDAGLGLSAGATGGGSGGSAEQSAAGVGTEAIAMLEPVADSASVAPPSDPSVSAVAARPVMGTATFTQRQAGVNLAISITGCVMNTVYLAVILDGTDCSQSTLLGPDWDAPRGEGISAVMCTGTSGVGRTYYARAGSDAKLWTIDGPARSDVVGHAIVLYASDNPMRPLACGTITREALAPRLDAGTGDAHVPPVEIRVQLSGLCLAKMIVRSNTQACPDPGQFETCVSANCDMSECAQQCSDYAACLETASQACDPSCGPAIDKPCADCMGKLQTCVLGFCIDQFACAAPPTPGGPCSKLEACCGMQGDSAASCLDTVHLVERISGDPSCLGAMSDWDVTSHLPVPCNFQ
jgi:hypothetical protein